MFFFSFTVVYVPYRFFFLIVFFSELLNCRSRWLWACDSSIFGVVGSNTAESMDIFLSCECCVLSGRGLCDELITRPGES